MRRLLSHLPIMLLVLGALVVAPGATSAQKKGGVKPKPDLADAKYGPHERNVLDLWKAKSDKPTPLVVFIHGGGFRGGSKEALSPALLDGLLAKGISVMAINYRLSPEVSFPAHYMDCARAIQFARSKAKEWNLDPTRVGSTGGSAGAGTSLWIGFHDDMADPKSGDPVLRESTRLTCMAVAAAQSSYDPRVIKEWIGEAASKHPALQGFYGLKADELDTPKAYKLYEAASPINYLTKDDPPVYASYGEVGEIPADAKAGKGIHHINFGLRLKEKMDALKIECTVRSRKQRDDPDKEMVEFFVKHLGRNQDKAPQPKAPEKVPPLEVNDDAAKEFTAATKKAADMSRYAFTLRMKLDQDGRESVSPVGAKVNLAVAVEIKIGSNTYYQKGNTLVYPADGEWKKFERGARVVEPPAARPEKGVRVTGMLGFFASLKAPHELLADFGSKMKPVTKAEQTEDGCTVFSGDLTEAAIKYLAMHGPGHHGGGKMEVAEAYRGHAKFWVNGDGVVVKFEFYTEGTTRNPAKDRVMKVKNTRTYEIKDVGSTKVEVPKDALKVLGGP